MDIKNKTIYMTYKKQIPNIVYDRWIDLNKDYKIDFSLDEDCIKFIKDNFNDYIANLFTEIHKGMYKADLWRLCKLYINGGIYADVDLVPYLDIDLLDKNISFYSCLSCNKKSIFQAFIINYSKKNPLILCFLISFLQNNPYKYINGPTFDMYNCIKYNLNNIDILPNLKYELDVIKININIGSSDSNIKFINLYFFPNDIEYSIKLIENNYKDKFYFNIKDNILFIKRLDENNGWGYNHSINICIKSKESIFLFEEITDNTNKNILSSYYIVHNNNKILDCRDINYYINNGW